MLPFHSAGTIGPITLVLLKDRLKETLRKLGFDVPTDFGPMEPSRIEHFRNREPGSVRHALEGIMVGERRLSKDTRASRRNLIWVAPLIAGGAVLAALNFTALSSGTSPLLFFLGLVAAATGLVSLPRLHAFDSEMVDVWYGYDPPGGVGASTAPATGRQMPTTAQLFAVHIGAGRVSSVDVRGKGLAWRDVKKVLKETGDLESVPGEVFRAISEASRLREMGTSSGSP